MFLIVNIIFASIVVYRCFFWDEDFFLLCVCVCVKIQCNCRWSERILLTKWGYILLFLFCFETHCSFISDPCRGCYMGLCAFFFFSSFFSATILSGPYLWNRYSQRLQIQCAAWSCGLIVHCCLPSNSLRFFFRQDFVRAISLEPLPAETPNWVCCLALRSNFALLLTIQFASLFLFFFFFSPRFCPGHISGTVTRRDSKFSVLLGPAV